MSLSKEEKKALKRKCAMEQKIKMVLSKEDAECLFNYLDEKLEESGCDNTLKYTLEWVNLHIDEDLIPSVLDEIEEMGGYCDCEVIFNCYEEYGLS